MRRCRVRQRQVNAVHGMPAGHTNNIIGQAIEVNINTPATVCHTAAGSLRRGAPAYE